MSWCGQLWTYIQVLAESTRSKLSPCFLPFSFGEGFDFLNVAFLKDCARRQDHVAGCSKRGAVEAKVGMLHRTEADLNSSEAGKLPPPCPSGNFKYSLNVPVVPRISSSPFGQPSVHLSTCTSLLVRSSPNYADMYKGGNIA